MVDTTPNLAALIGSRICHDLISPVGAIHNGLELLSLGGAMTTSGPEMQLIQASCDSANARIRYFRVAFGTAGSTQKMSRREIMAILTDVGKNARILTDWRPKEDLPRRDVQMGLLALMCFETAMPQGGEVVFERDGNTWRITGRSERLSVDDEIWNILEGGPSGSITPAKVQFALLPVVSAEVGRPIRVRRDPTEICLLV